MADPPNKRRPFGFAAATETLLKILYARRIRAALFVFAFVWACDVSGQAANPEEQIAQALLAAPADKAEGAWIFGYARNGSIVQLREGAGDFHCFADNPADESFSTSCHHASLEPYFARGRELSAEGVTGEERYAIRFREIESGTLQAPAPSATQYIFDGAWDRATQTGTGSVRWVVYVPGATPESTGLSEQPSEGGPWIMLSGTPGAHIMIMPPQG